MGENFREFSEYKRPIQNPKHAKFEKGKYPIPDLIQTDPKEKVRNFAEIGPEIGTKLEKLFDAKSGPKPKASGLKYPEF